MSVRAQGFFPKTKSAQDQLRQAIYYAIFFPSTRVKGKKIA